MPESLRSSDAYPWTGAARTSACWVTHLANEGWLSRESSWSGQGELKSCAARRIVGSPQAAAVRFNNGAADPQSHARAVSLGGKERCKDLVRLLWWEPHAGIADRDQHLAILTALRLDGEFALPSISFIASMLFIMRLISTCCSCTRSPMT
jgi:hypothetical protein